ncbi:hypothetical protein DsansV1_C13g0119481 [Dioscorea sansibarensis]
MLRWGSWWKRRLFLLSDLMGERWNLEIPASSFSAVEAAEGSVKGFAVEVETRGRRLRRRRQRKKVRGRRRRRTAARMMPAERILVHRFIFGGCVYLVLLYGGMEKGGCIDRLVGRERMEKKKWGRWNLIEPAGVEYGLAQRNKDEFEFLGDGDILV